MFAQQSVKRVLFICNQNRLRSPTAEQVFADYPGLEVASAGTNNDAENPLTGELVEWADMVVVMERQHKARLQRKFRTSLRGQYIICSDIPNDYRFMDPELVYLLTTRMARHLPKT
ncbi:MAG: phosphotyrosine protein phosphatase [Novosphingobium sp.]|nr:phosphotyrosine protein phosphatase [Novosphingobium sp.]